MAQSRPSGIATASAISDRKIVPHSSGSTPNEACSPAKVGDHLVPNRKSAGGTSPKNEIVSNSSEPMIASVVATETKAAPISATLIAPSARERAEGR
jgi:hypothetical protein